MINCPRIFAVCWGLIKSWLAEDTKKKVHIMASESVWRPKLASVLEGGDASLPDLFGGPAKTERPDGQPVPLLGDGASGHPGRGARDAAVPSGGAGGGEEAPPPRSPMSLWRKVKKAASPRKLLGRRKPETK